MVRLPYAPDTGDLVWLRFGGGRRPALIVSPRSYDARAGLALVCPITSRAKGYPFEVPLPADGMIGGVVLADHIKNLDWKVRNAEFAAKVDAAVMTEAQERLRPLLGL